jgi:protein SCO1/2
MMISVDPGRDSPEQLARYVPHFDPSFTGVSVAAEHLPSLTAAFGVAYAYVPAGDADYSVDHTAAVFLVDPETRVAAVFLAPHEPESMAEDYRRILDTRNAD